VPRYLAVDRLLLPVDHDNGYGTALSSAVTAGHGKHLVLLKAHRAIAHEIDALQLPTTEIPGLFMDEKLVVKVASPKLGFSYASVATIDAPVNGGVVKPANTKASPQPVVKTLWKRDSKLVRSRLSYSSYTSN
jgi:hypothetical protein